MFVMSAINDSVRYSLTRTFATGDVALAIMTCHLEWEASANCTMWFARIPTEGNIADHPSRFQRVQILTDDLCCNKNASDVFCELLERKKQGI